jgi:hypothetical protein
MKDGCCENNVIHHTEKYLKQNLFSPKNGVYVEENGSVSENLQL